jgi:hypothetical protein
MAISAALPAGTAAAGFRVPATPDGRAVLLSDLREGDVISSQNNPGACGVLAALERLASRLQPEPEARP